MSFREAAQEGAYTIGIAPQTALNTAGSSFEYIECALFTPEPEATQVDTPRGHEQYGADQAPLPGREHQRITLKGPVTGQPGAYVAASDTPSAYGLSRFLDFLGGSAAIAYQLNGINANDADEISLVTSTGKYGCLIASINGTSAKNLGFVKALSGGGPYACTLFEDMFSQPANGDERLATKTFYPSAAALTNVAYTIRQVFDHANQDRPYVGFVPTAIVLMVEDDRLMWEVPGIVLSDSDEASAVGGGLQSLTSLLAMAPATEGSRHPLNEVQCGTRDVVLRIDFGDPIIIPGPYSQGVYQVVMRRPTITAEVAVPNVSDFEATAGIPDLLAAWRNRTAVTLTGYHGLEAGKLLAWAIRGGRVMNRPRRQFINGIEHTVATVRAGTYTGDSASTDAGNKPFVIAIG